MHIAVLLLLNLLAQHVSANDLLWEKLKTEADLVVLMRHTQPAGGNPLAWDESGSCKGESMLTVEGKAHARKIGEAFAKRGLQLPIGSGQAPSSARPSR